MGPGKPQTSVPSETKNAPTGASETQEQILSSCFVDSLYNIVGTIFLSVNCLEI